MIQRILCSAAAVIGLGMACPAGAATCTERVEALDTRLKHAAESASSTSSGGQGVAAARESQAMQSRDQGHPIAPHTVPPFQQEGKEASATREAAGAGAGGDRIMQARAKLNEARARSADHDDASCLDLIGQAERHLEGP